MGENSNRLDVIKRLTKLGSNHIRKGKKGKKKDTKLDLRNTEREREREPKGIEKR